MPNLSVLPEKVDPAFVFIGPTTDSGSLCARRILFPHRRNETISVADRVFAKSVTATSSQERAEAKNGTIRSEKYEEMIRDHVNRRVAVFFQQLVCCYGTRLHFEIGKTRHQGESATSVQLVNQQGKKEKLFVRNAAHSSTLPCIIAYEGKAWKKHIEEQQAKPKGFVYLYQSDTYKRANSTLEMSRAINEADIEIDGKGNDSILRTRSLALLNAAAAGDKEPVQALKEFLTVMATLSSEKEQSARKVGVKKALEFFADEIQLLQESAAEPRFFEQLLDLQVDANATSASLRSKIYKIRYRAIRAHQCDQTKILDKISKVQKKVLGALAGSRKPTYFDTAFSDLLCKELPSAGDRRRFKKLVASPGDGYFRETSRRMTVLTATKVKVEAQLPVIQELAKSTRLEFKAMRTREVLLRGRVARELRTTKGWNQTLLASKIKISFPRSPASQSTISRIENNIKLVSPSYARELAAVFKVDPALFLPSFFSS